MTDFSEIIKSSIKISEVAKQNGIEVNSSGFILCPFHSEKSASLKIFTDNTFYCFGCGTGGDVITFAKKLYNIDFNQAIFKLNYDFNLSLPIGRRLTRSEQNKFKEQNQAAQERIAKDRQKSKELSDNYYHALDRLMSLKYIIKHFKPANPEEEIPVFQYAIKNIDYAEYLCNMAELERRMYERRQQTTEY